MEMCMDDKWKLSKKGSMRLGTVVPTATATGSTVGLKVRMSRGLGRSVLGRHASLARQQRASGGRLASLAREQRARFYIMRRCVTMLVCWRD
ncbi:hypothetical protein ACQ4PT_047909 [Festuca glaucescens]